MSPATDQIDGSNDGDLAAYDYQLPPDLIANQPSTERSGSRLLVYGRDDARVRHAFFGELPRFLRPGDLLVVNDVRVLPARLRARRSSGGAVEVLLHPKGCGLRTDSVFSGTALLRPSAKVSRGAILQLDNGHRLRVDDDPGGETRAVSSDSPLDRLLEGGELPLPPYLGREEAPTAQDAERYQTVFASRPGAIAAPTAGLHFTPELLGALQAQGVGLASLTLFVGPGTFLPVRCARLEDHSMHEESYEVPEETRRAIAETRARGGRVIAVGTTTTRALESAADHDGLPRPGLDSTKLMIRPPYSFRGIDALITNFHLPRSTLLCLVSAFAGRERVLALYREAIEARYRFYSYGDAMLLY